MKLPHLLPAIWVKMGENEQLVENIRFVIHEA